MYEKSTAKNDLLAVLNLVNIINSFGHDYGTHKVGFQRKNRIP